jgi:hypothetical protein
MLDFRFIYTQHFTVMSPMSHRNYPRRLFGIHLNYRSIIDNISSKPKIKPVDTLDFTGHTFMLFLDMYQDYPHQYIQYKQIAFCSLTC